MRKEKILFDRSLVQFIGISLARSIGVRAAANLLEQLGEYEAERLYECSEEVEESEGDILTVSERLLREYLLVRGQFGSELAVFRSLIGERSGVLVRLSGWIPISFLLNDVPHSHKRTSVGCCFIKGLLRSLFNKYMESSVEVWERTCILNGGEYCEFVVIPK